MVGDIQTFYLVVNVVEYEDGPAFISYNKSTSQTAKGAVENYKAEYGGKWPEEGLKLIRLKAKVIKEG